MPSYQLSDTNGMLLHIYLFNTNKKNLFNTNNIYELFSIKITE
jgi:hypothetical protein